METIYPSIQPTLPLRTLIALHDALASLEGTPTIVKDGSKPEKVVTVPYDFSGSTRWNIVKNLKILKGVLEITTKIRDELISEVSGGKDRIEPGETEKIAAFNEKWASLLSAQESTAGLLGFSKDDLNLDKNAIPPATILALQPLIKDF